jgi:hypothetical protein
MKSVLKALCSDLVVGDIQRFRDLWVLPVFSSAPEGPPYLTLPEAMQAGVVQISEVSQSGSVPELTVINSGGLPVLILAGEELMGAKQNRVLNTTVLVQEHAKVVVPVSCTEHGRWSYRSARFEDSGTIMPSKLRALKQRSVSRSLASRGLAHSDQQEVWDGIRDMEARLGRSSPTSAMRDAFEASRVSLDETLRDLTPQDGQRGVVFFLNGRPAGFEWVSRTHAMQILLGRIARSYAMQAVADAAEPVNRPDEVGFTSQDLERLLTGFEPRMYPGVSRGYELRLEAPALHGAGLIEEKAVIHLAVFWADASSGSDPGTGRRGHYRNRVPHPRSYWVVPGRLLAGCYPGDRDPELACQKLDSLLDAGIRNVINLMEPDETDHDGRPFVAYDELFMERAARRGADVTVRRLAIADLSAPTRETMRQILDLIDEALGGGMPTYVHCRGGRGRTGTVVGCYLARHGLASGSDVLDYLASLRRNTADANLRSPDMPAQLRTVLRWKLGD